MDTLMHADIFFFVTTIVALILGIFVTVIAFYIIKVVKNVHAISETVKNESEHVVEDLAALRLKFKQDTSSMQGFGGILRKLFMGGAFLRKTMRSAGKKHEEKESN